MKYTKPEVAVLGQAVRVIEQLIKGGKSFVDHVTGRKSLTPAYDLDE